MFRKMLSYCLIFSLLLQGSPALAIITAIDDEAIATYQSRWGHTVPLPASPDFQAVPGETAAGVMVFAKHEGSILALLGFRDDEDSWCNFGGKSEEKHETLLQTAVTECSEESIGVYAFHPEELRQSPSHTVRGDSEYPTYRMYLKEGKYRPTEEFTKLLDQAKDSHNKEYRQYRWVPLQALIDCNGLLGEMHLYSPMVRILKEQMIQIHLKRILKDQILKPVHTYSPLAGSLIDPSDALWIAEHNFNSMILGNQSVRTFNSRTLVQPLMEEEKNRQHFLEALNFVRKFSRERGVGPRSEDTKKEEVAAASSDPFIPQSLGRDSPTLRHLKLTLGEFFGQDPRVNIENYLDRLNQSGFMETRTKILYQEDTIDSLLRLMEEEQSQWEKGKFVLYHGAEGDIGNLYEAFSALRSVLLGIPNSLAVRGNDLVFSRLLKALDTKTGDSTVKAIQEHFDRQEDYSLELKNTRLCTNLCLTAGPGCAQSTSNSLEYWLNSHSVESKLTRDLFSVSFELLGLSMDYGIIQSLFFQYYGIDHSQNGMLLQLFLDPSILKNYAHAHHVRFYDEKGTITGEGVRDLGAHFKDLYRERSVTSTPPSEGQSRRLIDTKVAPEVWFYPVPGLMDQISGHLYRKQEIPEKELQSLKKRIRETIEYSVADWLVRGIDPIPGSFYVFEEYSKLAIPPIKQAYDSVFPERKRTGSPVEFPVRAIIEGNNAEIFSALLDSSPELKKIVEKDENGFTKKAFFAGSFNIAEFLMGRYFQDVPFLSTEHRSGLFSWEEINLTTYKFFLDRHDDSSYTEFIFKHLDFSSIEISQRSAFLRRIVSKNYHSYLRMVINYLGRESRDFFLEWVSRKWGWERDTKVIPLTQTAVENFDVTELLMSDSGVLSIKRFENDDFRKLILDLKPDLNAFREGIPLGFHLLQNQRYYPLEDSLGTWFRGLPLEVVYQYLPKAMLHTVYFDSGFPLNKLPQRTLALIGNFFPGYCAKSSYEMMERALDLYLRLPLVKDEEYKAETELLLKHANSPTTPSPEEIREIHKRSSEMKSSLLKITRELFAVGQDVPFDIGALLPNDEVDLQKENRRLYQKKEILFKRLKDSITKGRVKEAFEDLEFKDLRPRDICSLVLLALSRDDPFEDVLPLVNEYLPVLQAADKEDWRVDYLTDGIFYPLSMSSIFDNLTNFYSLIEKGYSPLLEQFMPTKIEYAIQFMNGIVIREFLDEDSKELASEKACEKLNKLLVPFVVTDGRFREEALRSLANFVMDTRLLGKIDLSWMKGISNLIPQIIEQQFQDGDLCWGSQLLYNLSYLVADFGDFLKTCDSSVLSRANQFGRLVCDLSSSPDIRPIFFMKKEFKDVLQNLASLQIDSYQRALELSSIH